LDFKYFGFSGNTIIDFLANHIENGDSAFVDLDCEVVKAPAQLPDNPVKVYKERKDSKKSATPSSSTSQVSVAEPIFETDVTDLGIH
jgi:hypothetical protein